ncbi:MAG: DUF5916 domain-containing protein [Bacteroidetes bacterium]|nr:DUF5916 domain-containing protein [Bacteroidota bacterium]MDE2672487.1 DUF5916 domain-containing protein [Bacteroidota bacterium]
MVPIPYRVAIGGYRKPACLQLLQGLALALITAGSAQAQDVSPTPEVPLTIRAARVQATILLDGDLSETDWQRAVPARGFRQVEPQQGNAATLDTEVRILYDDRNLYVGAICYDTAGASGVRVRDLRRDFDYFQNDLFGISLDPFLDGRSAIVFQVNPAGGQRDIQVIDGNIYNRDWDAVWDVRTMVTDQGWAVEMVIPWYTLRYPEATTATQWGINFVRNIRRHNEITGWSLWPRAYSPYRMDYAGVLEGIEPPPPSTNLRVQPYLVMRDDRTGSRDDLFDGIEPEVGGDLKWAVTPSTVLDLTVNTDFAQVDADRQVVNLTRFSVFFPEKRAFFLENANLFRTGSTETALPFFSRRIGLDNTGQPVPIDAGLRLVSRTARRSLGGMVIRQRRNDQTPTSHVAVGRFIQNFGSTNRIGALATVRHDDGLAGMPSVLNAVGAVDGQFRFTRTLTLRWMGSASWTQHMGGEGFSTYAWLSNDSNWGYLGFLHTIISENYNPGVGFVSRRDLIVTSPAGIIDLRPAWKPDFVRRFQPGFISYIYHRLTDGQFQEAWLSVTPLNVDFQNGAEISIQIQPNWQELDADDVTFFRPLGVELVPGRYHYLRYNAEVQSDLSRKYSGSFELTVGDFFDGRLTNLELSVRLAPSPRMALSAAYEFNRAAGLGTKEEETVSHLFGPELRLALNPRLQFNAFYQYNTVAEQANWNVRFSYEFRPLSYLYLVFNDNRYFVNTSTRRTDPEHFATQQQAIIKLTYLRQL